eukprot:tig00020904_g15160.t1
MTQAHLSYSLVDVVADNMPPIPSTALLPYRCAHSHASARPAQPAAATRPKHVPTAPGMTRPADKKAPIQATVKHWQPAVGRQKRRVVAGGLAAASWEVLVLMDF